MSALVLISALIIGLSVGLLGSGGSILTVPVLVHLVQLPEKVAIVSSLGVGAQISFTALLPYLNGLLCRLFLELCWVWL